VLCNKKYWPVCISFLVPSRPLSKHPVDVSKKAMRFSASFPLRSECDALNYVVVISLRSMLEPQISDEPSWTQDVSRSFARNLRMHTISLHRLCKTIRCVEGHMSILYRSRTLFIKSNNDSDSSSLLMTRRFVLLPSIYDMEISVFTFRVYLGSRIYSLLKVRVVSLNRGRNHSCQYATFLHQPSPLRLAMIYQQLNLLRLGRRFLRHFAKAAFQRLP